MALLVCQDFKRPLITCCQPLEEDLQYMGHLAEELDKHRFLREGLAGLSAYADA